MINVMINAGEKIHCKDVFLKMVASDDYNVVAVFTEYNNEIIKKAKENNIQLLNHFDCRHVGFFDSCSSKRLYKHNDELNFMLRRFINCGNVNEVIRERFIENTTGYWERWLATNNIGLIVFQFVPHEFYDYIIYLLAKKMGIEVIFIEKTFWPDRILLKKEFMTNTPYESICNKKYVYEQRRITDEIDRVVSNLPPYWTQKKLESHSHGVIKRIYDLLLNKKFKLTHLHPGFYKGKYYAESELNKKNILKHFLWRVEIILQNKQPGFYGNKYYTLDKLSRMNVFWHLSWKARIILKRLLLKREYRKNSIRNFDKLPDNKFILFFLQVQPEKSTSPLGGKFYDQLEAIRLIKNWLPEDVKLVVREHPSQFKKFQNLHQGRDIGFYKDINRVGAILVNHNLNKMDVENKAIGIITVAGSIALESFMKGKHAAYMGYPWYSGIDGIYKITSKNNLSEFLDSCVKTISKNQIESSLQEFLGDNTMPGVFEDFHHQIFSEEIPKWSSDINDCIDQCMNNIKTMNKGN